MIKCTLQSYEASDIFKIITLFPENSFKISILPRKYKLWTFPRGPHVHKKSKQQFRSTLWTVQVLFFNVSNKNLDLFLFAIQKSKFRGTIRWTIKYSNYLNA